MSAPTLRRRSPTSPAAEHAEWLGLIDVSGPFLSVKVLLEAFPQGLDADEPLLARELRRRLGEWYDNNEARKPDYGIHDTFIRFVLGDILEIRPELLQEGPAIPPTARAALPEHRVALAPKFAVGQSGVEPALLISVYPPATGLEKALPEKGFHASPVERMRLLLRHTGIQSGLVTNGERWTLVHAPADRTATFATWDANDLLDERLTFRAFRSLLGKSRLIDHPSEDTLSGLLERSRDDEREVTDQLGLQVRRAVELLVTALDKADHERGGAVIKAVRLLDRNEPAERTIYEAVVAVCMRIVFLLAAEARGLLPDDEPWLESYAVGTLRTDLQTIADRSGEELLDRRFDAWPRLLATFRAVHSGVEHDRVRLLGYGGGLFDPDRYPFLERGGDAAPRISNRVMLRVLDALQTLEVQVPGGGKERRPLSYRALGVEQIGHVYERLLDHTAIRADDSTLGLVGTSKKEPEVAIEVLDREKAKGQAALLDLLVKETGRSRSSLARALEKALQPERSAALAEACQHDAKLIAAAAPYLGLIRDDAYGVPTVFLPDSIYVTESEQRASTGTYYTPPSLTEPIVQYALEPIVYRGPTEGISREQWGLKRPSELLDLKVCDIAMGSGAFLVAACRYLAARLVESWEMQPEEAPPDAGVDLDERDLTARRIVAERCLYGVDVNPLAVEIAKVSMWLTTMRRDRPFTFLDHALRNGDSLLGVTRIDQFERLTLSPKKADSILLEPAREGIRTTLDAARALRERIESTDAIDIREVDEKTALLALAQDRTATLRTVGDLIVGAAIEEAASKAKSTTIVEAAAADIGLALLTDSDTQRDRLIERIEARAADALMVGRAPGEPDPPRPFHWVLEFPEVFQRDDPGFDAVLGNPPYLGGTRVTGVLGTAYRNAVVSLLVGRASDRADLVVFFLLRAVGLARTVASTGFVTTDTVAQGDSREVGLLTILDSSWVISRAVSGTPWPGAAALRVAHLWLVRPGWTASRVLDGADVREINSYLAPASRVSGEPYKLHSNTDQTFEGVKTNGIGFLVDDEEASRLVSRDPRNQAIVRPYLTGDDVLGSPSQESSRWVINFGDLTAGDAESLSPSCWQIIEERVKPVRQRRRADGSYVLREPLPTRYWQFAEKRTTLFTRISSLDEVIVISRVTKYCVFALVPNRYIYSERLVVIVPDDPFQARVLPSTFHEVWAHRYSSGLEARLMYSPSDAYATFPFPANDGRDFDDLGKRLFLTQRETTSELQVGLTALYNRIHEQPEDESEPIDKLRRLRLELDRSVANAYGWTDLVLDHDFRETPLGLRYTLSEAVKTEMLDRLLELNHSRYADEVALGLHGRSAKTTKKASRRPPAEADSSNDRLFD